MGSLGIYLASPLQVSNGTSSQINLNVFEAWGQDFEMFHTKQGSDVGYCTQSMLTAPGVKNTMIMSAMSRPFSNLKELMQRPVTIGSYPLNFPAATIANTGVTPLIIPIHPTWGCGRDALWSGLLAAYNGLRGGFRVACRFTNINQSTNLRLMYIENHYPTDPSGSFLPNVLAGALQYDYFALTMNQASGATSNGNYNTSSEVQITFQNSNGGVQLNTVASGTPGATNAFGMQAFSDTILDPYSQPEVLLEIPDPCPNLRTQPTVPLRPGWAANPLTAYDPARDRTMGWLVVLPGDNPIAEGILQGTLTVSMMAADDTRFFWYNGGPTTINPGTTGYIKAGGTAYTYQNIINN
eukprot:gnl/Spiro4/13048_TR6921_c0_g1_i1.p1 gnl/Spiro4/13048_TR6921_c0_g1~~gnl/Spiro4/13048_TR6921_c0_g1_i1.p1  ORF type:complete len:404 (-),score=-46.32 gnl/Spiro4/13048_TR6921_c0_g1_i1:241-1299(-)